MNQKLLAVVAGLLLSVGAFQLSAQNGVADYLQRADKQFELGAFNVAVISLNEVLRLEPDNRSALARKADCMVALNRPYDALSLYDRALSLGHSDPDTKLKYGHALMQSGDYVGAKRWYNQYAIVNPVVGQHFMAACDQAQNTSATPAKYAVRLEGINSAGADFGPAFLGDKVVFNSSRKDLLRSNRSADAGVNELYIASTTYPEGLLTAPVLFLSEAQNNLLINEGPISFNKNATKAVFCSNKMVEGSRQITTSGVEMALFFADVNAEGKLLNVQPFPYNKTGFGVGFPYLSEDGTTLLFASNVPEGLGGWDLYVSNYDQTKGTWSLPRNLGGLINTPGNEITPFLNESKLYFSSDWHHGLGGLDVFKAEFQNGYASNVVNLGIGVNSSRDDYGFIYQSAIRKGYLTSTRNEGKGNEDIWQVMELTEQFAITVRDNNYQPLAGVEIDLSACNGGVLQTDNSGKALFLGAWNAGNCAVSIRKTGYSPVFLSANAASDRNISVTMVALPQALAVSAEAKTPSQLSEALGTVLDVESKDPILGAIITATPLPAGTKVEAVSNSFGQYSFMLEPNRSYTLSIVAKGYADQVLNFYSSGAGSQSTVSQVSLRKGAVANSRGDESLATFTWETPVQKENKTEPAMAAVPVAKPQALVVNDNLVDGYSVQLTAFITGATDAELSQFEALKSHGNLYQVKEDQKNKLRLGVFTDRATAEIALQRARAIKKDAFLVEEKKVNGDWVFKPMPKELEMSPMIVSKNAQAEPLVAAPLLSTNAAPIAYAILVKSADINKPLLLNDLVDLGNLGNLYTSTENGIQQVRLGTWSNRQEAERIQAQLTMIGHQGAVVVVEKAVFGTSSTPVPAITPKSVPAVPVPSVVNPAPARGDLPDLFSPAVGNTEQLLPAVAKEIEVGVEYMVRICSLASDLSTFDVKKAEQAGGVVDARKSKTGSYILLLTGFAGKSAAQQATKNLIELGFKEAYLVKEKSGDGILRRVVE